MHSLIDFFQKNDVPTSFRYLKELVIPAAFVTKTTGDILKGLIKTGNTEDAYVVMDWIDVLPRASKVNWQFWSGYASISAEKHLLFSLFERAADSF